ncbi:MAG: UDP-2,3-diacylglucosamine diphosphatase LpxI [Candidatus Omnitrophica bacterium]|nr:UDP-2,3-diacylglucosamine diphosphatase LpxI [Candidatus Omnitrophota bacterium]
MTAPIGIIAGAGRFPIHVAQEARRQGRTVVAIGIQGWVDAALAPSVDAYDELAIGQLGRLIEWLKSHGVSQAIMAGKVTKAALLGDDGAFDAEALAILQQASQFSVPELLGALGKRLAADGITLLDSSTFLKTSLCPAGVLTDRVPTAAEEEDIRLGFHAARTLASLDIGQTVAVKRRVIVAVEALEGTDEAIRRAHRLAGSGLVVVKASAPHHDRRFDLPVIGLDTLKTLCEAQVSCLAVEAETTLLLERSRLIAEANAAGLCLVGLPPPDPGQGSDR